MLESCMLRAAQGAVSASIGRSKAGMTESQGRFDAMRSRAIMDRAFLEHAEEMRLARQEPAHWALVYLNRGRLGTHLFSHPCQPVPGDG
jgi:hypothetical protein